MKTMEFRIMAAAALALALVAPPAPAYYPPDDTALHAHGRILLESLRLIEEAGRGSPAHRAAALLFRTYRRELLRGVREADSGGGSLTAAELSGPLRRELGRIRTAARLVRGGPAKVDSLERLALAALDQVVGEGISRNPFTHFLDASGRGLTLAFGETAKVDPASAAIDFRLLDALPKGKGGGIDVDATIALLRKVSALPWELYTLMGPHPGSDSMADWYYADAVRAMRAGSPSLTRELAEPEAPSEAVADAMRLLGLALHMVADATVPQHANGEGGQHAGAHHVGYEGACDRMVDDPSFRHADALGPEDLASPGEYVRRAAGLARGQRAMSHSETPAQREVEPLVAAAESLGAGLMMRFFRTWSSEAAAVVTVRIDRVAMRRERDADPIGLFSNQEDYLAEVTIGGRTFRTGELTGCDEIAPQVLLPYAWFFPARIETGSATSEVPPTALAIRLLEANGGDDHAEVDIEPLSGKRVHHRDVDGSAADGGFHETVAEGSDPEGPAARLTYSTQVLPGPTRGPVDWDAASALADPRQAQQAPDGGRERPLGM